MVKESEVFKTNISVADSDFSLQKIYKDVKKKAENLGYDFFEKKQTSEPEKYGDEVKLELFFTKELDDFCSADISVEFLFYNLKRGKGADHGNADVSIKASRKLDVENKWGKTAVNKFLFEIYINIKKKEFKKKYTAPIAGDADEIAKTIKGGFGLET